MKLRLLSLSILALLAFSSCKDKLTGPPATTPSTSDTVAYWTFSGNLKDVTGNGHDGTNGNINDTVSYGPDRFGHANSALVFDGNSNVRVANKSDINFTGNDSYTISAWVKTTSLTDAGIITKGPADGSYPGYRIGVYAGVGGSAGTIAVWITDAGNGTAQQATNRFADGQWHLITIVVTAHSSIVAYLDSAYQTTLQDAAMEPELYNSAPLSFGINPNGTDTFIGSLDDIIFFNRALDPVEVTARYHEGGWPIPSPWNTTTSTTTENLVTGQFVNSTTGFVSGEDGVVLQTGDAGSTWNLKSPAPVFSGSNTGNIYGVSFFDASTGFAAGDQRDISLTTDGGSTWNLMDASNLSQSELIRSICFANRNNGFVGTSDAVTGGPSGSIYQTTDGGISWNPVFHTQGGIFNINFNIPGSNGMNGTAIGRYGVSYWTADGGTTWNTGSSDQPNSTLYRTTFTSATTGFAVGTGINAADTTHGYILRTDDGGHTWKTIYTIALGLNGIASLNGSIITAAGYGGVVIESTDGGTTWTQSNAGNSRWSDVQCVNKRTFLFGVNGNIAHRDR